MCYMSEHLIFDVDRMGMPPMMMNDDILLCLIGHVHACIHVIVPYGLGCGTCPYDWRHVIGIRNTVSNTESEY